MMLSAMKPAVHTESPERRSKPLSSSVVWQMEQQNTTQEKLEALASPF